MVQTRHPEEGAVKPGQRATIHRRDAAVHHPVVVDMFETRAKAQPLGQRHRNGRVDRPAFQIIGIAKPGSVFPEGIEPDTGAFTQFTVHICTDPDAAFAVDGRIGCDEHALDR